MPGGPTIWLPLGTAQQESCKHTQHGSRGRGSPSLELRVYLVMLAICAPGPACTHLAQPSAPSSASLTRSPSTPALCCCASYAFIFALCLLTVLTNSSTLCCHCLPSGTPARNLCILLSDIVRGLTPFAWWSHNMAASGHCTARELQAHTAWLEGKGEPLFGITRLFGDACHLCTRPSLHSSCTTQCTFFCEPHQITIYPGTMLLRMTMPLLRSCCSLQAARSPLPDKLPGSLSPLLVSAYKT